MKKVSKIKILTITPGLNICGGIESYAMNYYTNIKDEVKMDFITHEINDNYYKKIIEENGDKVFLFPKIGLFNIKQVSDKIDNFFKQNHDYDIVHCHMANAAFLYLKAAKKYGIKIRILHSHQNKAADTLSHAVRNFFLIKLGKKYSNVNFACSELAGDYLFKNKKYYVIKNAINSKRFKYNDTMRRKIRKELNLNNFFVIGNVGRFCAQKNQLFLLDIFKYVRDKKKVKLLLIGSGVLQDDIENKIRELDLQDDVIILPPQSAIEDYYQAMDMFVLPSLYEGLGIVNVEAQGTGLKTIVSNKIPKEAKICDLIEFVDLKANVSVWGETIINNMEYKRQNHAGDLKEKGYDIENESKKIVRLYRKIINKGC